MPDLTGLVPTDRIDPHLSPSVLLVPDLFVPVFHSKERITVVVVVVNVLSF